MPLGLAFVAGGLATVNPCGFALLPALLSFYIGTEDDRPRATTVADALRVGGAVAVGVMGVFLVVGIPITMGASQVIRAVPWAGVTTGVALVVAGIVTLAGIHLSLPLRIPVRAAEDNRTRPMLAFGVAYGTASLGCTLPIFLSVIGASLASRGSATALLMVGSYALGMLAVVMALSLAAAFAREGLSARLKGLVPRMNRIGGVLLTLAGIYLTYYWGRVLWGPVATLGQDPIVGRVQRMAAGLERFAAGRGAWVVGIATALVVGSVLVTFMGRKRARDIATRPGEVAP
ncbi:MAG: cytochrome c biogenesis CcdA family protein [Actinomycetota bacterium]|nr:cytochrome c biogenesis CcdA family protein [Actinomycetota bacterium]